jgi:PAS domain S-box-containing protein
MMNTNSIRLLLIEDNPGDARLIREMLRVSQSIDYTVDICVTLSDGLEFARLHPVEVVLLDLSLPDSLGIETVYRFQSEANTLPVVVLTGFNDKTVGIQAVKAGAQDYLVKDDVDPLLLERAILNAIERHRIEIALRRSEESYRSLIEDAFNNSSIAVFILDKSFKIVWINHAAEAYFNIQREKGLGQDMRDLTSRHIKSLCDKPDEFLQGVLNAYQHESLDERIGCHILAGVGYAERWLEHSSRPIRSGIYAGGLIVQYADITELKKAEQAEHDQRILAEALRDTAAVLTSTLDVEEVLDRVLENVGHVLFHNAASIMLRDDGKVFTARQQGYPLHASDEKPEGVVLLSESAYLVKMIETGNSLVSFDIVHDVLWNAQVERNWWQSYLGTPIYLQEKIIGFINLYTTAAAFYSEGDAEWLEAFAEQAAIAIQNARLHEQSRELATIEERQRLARELHDSVTQALFTSTVMADSALRQWNLNPEKANSLLKQVLQLTTAALAEMRVLLLELRPQTLVQVSFEQLIQQLTASLKGRKQIDFEFDIDPIPALPSEVKISLYRIFQEILNNIVKHSSATYAMIEVKILDHTLLLSVRDNGEGFDLHGVAPNSLGLGIMQERANIIRATLNIKSNIGEGTQITVTWPYEERGTSS